MLQAISQGAGPVGYCPKVLKGVLLAVRFVLWSSFLAFLFWALRVLGALEALTSKQSRQTSAAVRPPTALPPQWLYVTLFHPTLGLWSLKV